MVFLREITWRIKGEVLNAIYAAGEVVISPTFCSYEGKRMGFLHKFGGAEIRAKYKIKKFIL